MLPKTYRLKSRGDFIGAFAGPIRSRSGPFNLICRKNNFLYNRFGFVVSTAVSKKAVQRNTLRRRLHDIVRHILPSLVRGYDCVIRAYPGSIELKHNIVQKHVHTVFCKVGIMAKNVKCKQYHAK